MAYESNSIWDAMKGIHYQRTIKSLEKAIKGTKDLKSALSTTLDIVVTAAKAEAGTFWFHDRDTDGRIRPFAIYGGADLGDFSLGMGEGIAGRVIERGEDIIVEDCTQDPRWQGKADAKTGFITKSMIVVPLIVDDYTFGCIQIINKKSVDFYDAQDLVFVKDLATFTAELFEKLGFVQSEQKEVVAGPVGVSFIELFEQEDEVEMEIKLRTIKEFSDLGVKDQQYIVQNMREIYATFKRNRKKTRRFGG